MRTILYILIGLLLISCANNDEQRTHQPISQLEMIRQDVIFKANHLSPEARFNLAIVDYSFQYPERFAYLSTIPKWGVPIELENDKEFLALCKKRKVSFNDFEYGLEWNKEPENMTAESYGAFLKKYHVATVVIGKKK